MMAVCIVVHSAVDSACRLRSILESAQFRVVLVGTSSDAGPVCDIETGNVGYGSAANAGFRQVGSDFDWYIVANDDLVTAEKTAGQIAQRLRDLDPTVGLWSFTGPSSGIAPRRPPPHHDETPPHGALLAIRRSVLQSIGGFDPLFFLYAEEIDLWLRLPEGIRSGYEQPIDLHHLGAESSGMSHVSSFELGRSTGLLARRHGYLARAAGRSMARTVWVAVRRREPRSAYAFLHGFVRGAMRPFAEQHSVRHFGAAPYAARSHLAGWQEDEQS